MRFEIEFFTVTGTFVIWYVYPCGRYLLLYEVSDDGLRDWLEKAVTENCIGSKLICVFMGTGDNASLVFEGNYKENGKFETETKKLVAKLEADIERAKAYA